MSKLPQITLSFWIMKILATTLGETGGDFVAQTLAIGNGLSSVILLSLFLLALAFQMRSAGFKPGLYWTVIVTTSTAGATIADCLDNTLKLGHAGGAAVLFTPRSWSRTRSAPPPATTWRTRPGSATSAERRSSSPSSP